MSATFLFRLKTKEFVSKVEAELKTATSGLFDVGVLTENNGLNCFLDYALHDPREKEAVQKAIEYLQTIATDKVYYVQCYDAFDEKTGLAEMEIGVEDIFERHYPSLSVGKNQMFGLRDSKGK